MKRIAWYASVLALIVLIACAKSEPSPQSGAFEHVILCGVLLDKDDYIVDGSDVYVASEVVDEKTSWLRIDDEDDKNIAYLTTDESMIEIPASSDMIEQKDGRLLIDMTVLAKNEGMTYRVDKARKLVVIGTFDRLDLAYSDVAQKVEVDVLPITWMWPEDGIENVEVEKKDGRVEFVFRPTGEVLGNIDENPDDFPAKNQYLLALDGGNYIVAELAEKDPRKPGDAPSDRNKSIEGIVSLLTSVKGEEKK